jgi:hypothetical protein
MQAKTLKKIINSALEGAFDLKFYRPSASRVVAWQGQPWDRDGLPDRVWGTKGFEFWTLLSLLLHGSKCKRVLELGSGRSTITLAEYATFSDSQFISVESSSEWLQKWRMEFRYLGLGLAKDPVNLVPVDPITGWHDVEAFRKAIAPLDHFDFAFIDGPNDALGNSLGMRDTQTAIQELRPRIGQADVLIIDDMQRRHVFDTLAKLVDLNEYDTCYYDYEVHAAHPNSLSISVRKSSTASLGMREVERLFGPKLYRDFNGAHCPQK